MATCNIGKMKFETYNGYDKIISALLEVILELTENDETKLFNSP